jgi:hypothetical protein
LPVAASVIPPLSVTDPAAPRPAPALYVSDVPVHLAVAASHVGTVPAVPAETVKQIVAAALETPPSQAAGASLSVTRESLFNVVAPGLKPTGESEQGIGAAIVYTAAETNESLYRGAAHNARIVSAIVTWIGPL